jgi:hypothetical protein
MIIFKWKRIFHATTSTKAFLFLLIGIEHEEKAIAVSTV